MVTAWLDRYLMGLDSGVAKWPTVQIQDNEGQWHGDADWPSTDRSTEADLLQRRFAGRHPSAWPSSVPSFLTRRTATGRCIDACSSQDEDGPLANL